MNNRFRIAFWCFAVIAGFLQAWAGRFYIEPDGVNYLDIADAYLRHDWASAINAYWSPLYSWLLAGAKWLLHPSPYWESTTLQALNFLLYILSLACFAYFFSELTSLADEQHGAVEQQSLPRGAWNLFGYSLFVYASLELIRVNTDTPDMLVAAACLLATGILLRIRREVTGWWAYLALGAVLALGYLAKAVMFPISFVFLFSSLFAARDWRKTAPRAALGLFAFLLVASPWLFTLSKAKGRFTFGDTGSLNYAWYVQSTGKPIHGVRLLSAKPPVEEFATPVVGTYPLWYDSTYWYEGVHPHFGLRAQLHALGINLGDYFRLFSAEKGIAVGLLVLVLFTGRTGTYARVLLSLWPFWLAAIAAFGLYALVHVETRFLGAAVVILWSILFVAAWLTLPDAALKLWVSSLTAVSILIAVTLAVESAKNLSTILKRPQNVEWEAAHELSRLGLRQGDLVALIGHSNVADYYAHLAKVRIAAQVPAEGVSSYWDANPESRRRVLNLFRQAGAAILVTHISPPSSQAEDWKPLGSTGYHVLFLSKLKNST